MSKIIKVDISDSMEKKYIDYALSVIIGRALPDVRDGLKWVHRRILYEMLNMKLTSDSAYRKSARIVGNVLGKYHPHGDTSVYDAMVRLAQDFNMRYVLVNGHGNWGSIDGDGAAHYRYTEAKMQLLTSLLLQDINKNTVDFIPNFDGEEQEPTVLPSRFPNMLVNGSEGIAVGFATAIPPHNLTDAINCILYQIDNPYCSIAELVDILKTPDFPTGGEILNPENMINVYTEGKGAISMRAKYNIEIENGINKIIITEIPYKVNKLTLVNDIYTLINNRTVIDKKTKEKKIIKAKIPQISEVLDESDREGMRISITLKKNVDVNNVLALLFKHTSLQCNYNANFTAIYKNKLLEHISLKDMNTYYINHQKEVITRRTQFELEKAEARLHIVNGLIIAINNIDFAIELIRKSKNKSDAKINLMNNIGVDEKQAESIVKLELHRLTGLDIEDTKNEKVSLDELTTKLRNILNNESELYNILKSELIDIRNKFGDDRRTKIISNKETSNILDISSEELIEDYNCYYAISEQNYLYKYLRKTDVSSFRLKEGDTILKSESIQNKNTLLVYTSLGNLYKLFMHNIPEKAPSEIGHYLPSLIQLETNEQIISVQTTRKYEGYLINCFENNKLVKIPLTSFKTEQKRMKLKNSLFTDSKLINQFIITDDIDILVKSSIDKVLITNTSQFNPKTSKNSNGDSLIKSKNDSIVSLCLPLSNIDTTKLGDIEYYKGKRGATGVYLKKEHKITLL